MEIVVKGNKLRKELSELRRVDLSEIRRVEGQRNILRGEISDLKRRLISIENEMATLKSRVKRVLEPALRSAEIQLQKVEEQIPRLEGEIREAEMEREKVEEEIKRLERLKEEISKPLLGVRVEAEKFMSELRSIDEKLRLTDEEYERIQSLLSKVELEIRTLQLHLNQYRERLSEMGYEKPLEVSEKNLIEIESMLRMMRLELERIGAVNQLAEARYAEQISRYKEISIRINEIEKEREAILTFIEEIERRKREAFMDAFNKVNENLNRYFSMLTDGGRASLRLENPENPFSGGVDMLVEFPNKPPILISGASSGERSVAAVAFLFALQGLNPASFYLFDEIDAHLDAFYIERLGDLLARESSKSQVVVITLKPEMISKAGKVYGVYQRNGVSHVVSTSFRAAD